MSGSCDFLASFGSCDAKSHNVTRKFTPSWYGTAPNSSVRSSANGLHAASPHTTNWTPSLRTSSGPHTTDRPTRTSRDHAAGPHTTDCPTRISRDHAAGLHAAGPSGPHTPSCFGLSIRILLSIRVLILIGFEQRPVPRAGDRAIRGTGRTEVESYE